ncbi:MAG: SIS domain-containing protein [Chloroflexi bacterium]|nr:SIS domain-containing protein [Chloroflexota bacterium]
MRQEIHEQPDVLTRLAASARPVLSEVAKRARDCQFAVLAARGSSDNASTYGKYLLEGVVGMPTALASPSLYTLYNTPPRLSHALVIGVSQSGQSADVVRVLHEAREQGAVTLVVTNTAGSPLTAAADHVILLDVGLERALAATKTVTAQCLVYALLAEELSSHVNLQEGIAQIGRHITHVLDREEQIAELAGAWLEAERAAIIGRGYTYGAAQECALKLKETCYMSAEPYSAADFQHGPLAMIESGYPLLAILNQDATLETTLDLMKRAHARGARIVAFSSAPMGGAQADPYARFVLDNPAPLISTIPFIVTGQIFAMRLATLRGYDPDISRGLSKVTVTI